MKIEKSPSIIRRRLFSKDEFNQNEAKKVIREFAKYAKNEGILPVGTQESEYRDQFAESYPFQPEVIDVLYKRWGSYPDFSANSWRSKSTLTCCTLHLWKKPSLHHSR